MTPGMLPRSPRPLRVHRAIAPALGALALCCALAACERAPAPAQPAPAPASPPAAAAPAAAAPVAAPAPAEAPGAPTASNAPASAVRGVLDLFAGDAPTWEVFAAQPDVTWFDREPVPAPGALGGEDARSRSGRIGWSDTDPPPGNLPPETEAGVTLTGRDAVEQVAFRKARPSTAYEAAIRAQLGADVQLARIADRCARAPGSQRPDRRGTAFFEVRIGSRAPLYMQGSADADGGNTGPGNTTFEFTRTRPDARIRDMGCVAG